MRVNIVGRAMNCCAYLRRRGFAGSTSTSWGITSSSAVVFARFLDEDAFAFGAADAFVRAFLRGTSGSSSLGIWVSGSGSGSGSDSGEGALRFATRLGFGAGSCLEGVSLGGAQESAYNDSPGAADVLALVPFVAALGLGLGFAGATEYSHTARTRG